MTIPAYRVETLVKPDGTVTLDHVPFQPGQTIEVTIRAQISQKPRDNTYPLRGTPFRYEQPFDPVSSGDWEALA